MLRRYVKFHEMVQYLRQVLCLTRNSLSDNEHGRFDRVFYRFQLCINLVGLGVVLLSEIWNLFFQQFSIPKKESWPASTEQIL